MKAFVKYFDQRSNNWDNRSARFNRLFLAAMEKECSLILKAKGYLFLNEVYDLLGLERTKEGQIYGWFYGGKKSNLIGFGPKLSDEKGSIKLIIETDGIILNYLKAEDGE